MTLPYNRNWVFSYDWSFDEFYIGYAGDTAKNRFEWGYANKVYHDIFSDDTMNFFFVSFDRPFPNVAYDCFFEVEYCNYYRYLVWTDDFLADYLYFKECVETFNTNTIDFKGSNLDSLLYDIDN